MKIIIHQAREYFQKRKSINQNELKEYIVNHHFYNTTLGLEQIIKQLKEGVVSENQQLKLYLKAQSNKQLFRLYSQVCNKSQVTYDQLARKLQTDIINVSHLCCKLKKLKFIDSDKDGVKKKPPAINIVYQQIYNQNQTGQLSVDNISKSTHPFKASQSFIFKELTLLENIWINVSSKHSIQVGGYSNEDIKVKVNKQGENKMLRRCVQAMKHIQKKPQRLKKIFQFKYINITPEIFEQKEEKQLQLNEAISKWLLKKFPIYPDLLSIINEQIREYIAFDGQRQSKRQCTPVKLKRYILILNFIDERGPSLYRDVERYIVEKQEGCEFGRVHKRSLTAILNGLCKIEVLLTNKKDEEVYYYPAWHPEPFNLPIICSFFHDGNGKNINNFCFNVNPPIKQTSVLFQTISPEKHHILLQAQIIVKIIQKLYIEILHKGFKRIIYSKRKSVYVPLYQPKINIMHLFQIDSKQIEEQKKLYIKTLFSHESQSKEKTEQLWQSEQSSYNKAINSVDNYLERHGKRQKPFQHLEHQVIKFIRKNVARNSQSMEIKYGKQWRTKFKALQIQKIVIIDEKGIKIAPQYKGFLM